MHNYYFNQLKDYEDGAVELSYGRNLMPTDVNYYNFTSNIPTIDILHNFLNKYCPIVDIVRYYPDLISMIEGNYHSLPIFMGLYEEKKGLLFGFDYDELIYDVAQIDGNLYHLTGLNGLVDVFFELKDFKTTCHDILSKIDDDIERIILHDYLVIVNAVKIKVNQNRSLAEIEKGINDSVEIIIKKLMKKNHLNPYL